jgi:O-antigen/teichoic acid export membrane protein
MAIPRAAPAGLSLRRNVSWTFAGNVVYAGCQWGMLMALAKLGSPEMVGRFALGLAVTAPVMGFARLGLRIVQATDAADQFRFGHYMALRLLMTALAFGSIAGLALVGGYRRETALLLVAIGASKAFENVSDMLYGVMQRQERMDQIAVLQMIKGPLSLAALAATLYFTGDVVWAATALAAIWALRLVAYDLRYAARVLGWPALRPRWDPAILARLALMTLPLGVAVLLMSLVANIPRYFIERQLGERQLGFFASMAYLIVMGSMVVEALGQSASPRLAKYRVAGDAASYRLLLGRLLGLAVAVGVAGVLASCVGGDAILSILYGPEYAGQPEVLTWLMVAAVAAYASAFLGHGIMASTRRYVALLLIHVGVAAVMAAGCGLLIGPYGLRGAAWATLAAYSAQVAGFAVLQARLLRRLERAEPPKLEVACPTCER